MTDIEYLMIAEQFPTLKHGSTDDQVGFARAIEQASRRAALDQSALICEAEAKHHKPSWDDYSYQACLDCADAIRALAGTET
jgi:hypothetical protein